MRVDERYDCLQSILRVCGDEGCHFLCLCSIAEQALGRPIDLIDAIRTSQSKGWIRKDFFVTNDGTPLLSYLTGVPWERRVSSSFPMISTNDYIEVKYYNPRTRFTHFRRRAFDTIKDSITVKEGYIQEYYIYSIRS